MYLACMHARTVNAGVHKAPANETLRGVVGLAQDLNARQQDALQELRINAIRKFAGRGIRVWGARTLSSDPQWKYVNMRRFLLYLERSIQAGIEWAVFAPNDAKLWARVKDSVSRFLLAHWRSGALLGDRAEKAFYVRCDQSTMTQADVVAGRLICEVGVAAVRPAEFVVIRITQQTLE